MVLTHLVDRRVQQESTEDEEHPGPSFQDRLPQSNEDTSEDQGDDDAHQQGKLLQLPWNVELLHEDEEDEQVVDRQAVLGQPHREELTACGMPLQNPDAQAEQHCQADEHTNEGGTFLGGGDVRLSPQDHDVQEEQGPHHKDGDDPDIRVNVQNRASEGIARRSGGLVRTGAAGAVLPGLCSRTVMTRS